MKLHHLKRPGAAAALAATMMLGINIASANASASAQPDQVCQIGMPYQYAAVLSHKVARPKPADILYSLPYGAWFRIAYYSDEYYYGHGDGKANGYLIRDAIDQASCHYT